MFILIHLAYYQLTEKIQNLNSDTAASMVFKFLLFQLPDCNTVTVVVQHAMGISESETGNTNCHFGELAAYVRELS